MATKYSRKLHPGRRAMNAMRKRRRRWIHVTGEKVLPNGKPAPYVRHTLKYTPAN